VRNPFEFYMKDPKKNASMDWSAQPEYPRPDYLSSSRKRLVPQLIFKGGILRTWKKKLAVALNKGFFDTLPPLNPAPLEEAEIAWFIYDLVYDDAGNQRTLTRLKTMYTRFDESLARIVTPKAGDVNEFTQVLQTKLDEMLANER